MRAALSLCLLVVSLLITPKAGHAETAGCAPVPKPVVHLAYGSRYQAADKSRSKIDVASNAAVNKALAPVEAYVRDLSKQANQASRDPAQRRALADCIVQSLAVWAKADALSDLESVTAQLSVGSRLAGFGMIYAQVRGFSDRTEDFRVIDAWLHRRAAAQMRFWETDAPQGAARGNLRAWSTLGVTLAAILARDIEMLDWAAASAASLQCEAAPDGSLPQEMKRGKYALHYQLHAIAPMVTTTLLLEQQGQSIRGVCDQALQRIVRFAFDDLQSGEKSAAHAGVVQSYFDGTEEMHKYELAWIEPYLLLHYDAEIDAFADRYRPFSHSKLGGNQDVVWARSF